MKRAREREREFVGPYLTQALRPILERRGVSSLAVLGSLTWVAESIAAHNARAPSTHVCGLCLNMLYIYMYVYVDWSIICI